MNESGLDKKPGQVALSPEARAVWDELDEWTRKIILKDCPFRNQRNAAIIDLRQRGVKIRTLRELTGLTKGALERFIPTKKKATADDAKNAKQVLNELRATFESFYLSVSQILNSARE
jgi:hypothetical protein